MIKKRFFKMGAGMMDLDLTVKMAGNNE